MIYIKHLYTLHTVCYARTAREALEGAIERGAWMSGCNITDTLSAEAINLRRTS